MDIHHVISQFQLPSPVTSVTPLHHGRIHATYQVQLSDGASYGLQVINHHVFPDVAALMHNLVQVSLHIQHHPSASLEPLLFINTHEGAYYVQDGSHYVRMFRWMDDTVTLETVSSSTNVVAVGQAVGNFQASLIDFQVDTLRPVLPDFHHTGKRFAEFQHATRNGLPERVEESHALICRLLHCENYTHRVVDGLANGTIPYRVTHNDTKLNNFLWDADLTRVRALVDWDTITSGSVLYDVGDALRSLCNTASEDTLDLSTVRFDVSIFESFMQGFLRVMGAYLSAKEKELLAFSPVLITYELTMRFLGDYCLGDSYFKTQRPHQNYERAMVQWTLLQSIEAQLPQLEAIVQRLLTTLELL